MKRGIFLLALFFPFISNSQTMQVTRTEAERAAVKSLYLTDNGYLTRQLVVTGVVEKRFGENVALYEILFETGESVIISGSRASQPIVAINIHSNGYSWLNNQEGRESGFLLLLEDSIPNETKISTLCGQ